jgi:hypothetical protein
MQISYFIGYLGLKIRIVDISSAKILEKQIIVFISTTNRGMFLKSLKYIKEMRYLYWINVDTNTLYLKRSCSTPTI